MHENEHVATAKDLLRVPRFGYREFAESSPIRRLLLINDRWNSAQGFPNTLVLGEGAMLLGQLGDGSLVAWEHTRRNSFDITVEQLFDCARGMLTLSNPGVLGPPCGAPRPCWTELNVAKLCIRDGIPLTISDTNSYPPLQPVDQAVSEAVTRVLSTLMCGVPRLSDIVEALNISQDCPELVEALHAFRAGLDADALHTCHRLRRYSAALYNYLVAQPGPPARYRREAVQVLPFMADYLATSLDEAAVCIRLAIDRRLPLIDAVAREFGVSRDTVKCVAGKTLGELGFEVRLEAPHAQPPLPDEWPMPMEICEFFTLLAWIPPQYRPSTVAEWREFHAVHAQLTANWLQDEAIVTHTNWLQDDAIAPKIVRFFAENGWIRVSTELRERYGSLQAIRDCNDFLDAVHGALVEEAKHNGATGMHRRRGLQRGRGNECCEAVVAFASWLGLRRLLELSRKWHERFNATISNHVADQDEGSTVGEDSIVEFPLREPLLLNGYLVAPLLSCKDLVTEGAAMRHCVATLYDRVVYEGVRVFSIRTDSGRRISTFDLSFGLDKDEVVIKLNQHRGPGNINPPRACHAIVSQFISLLKAEPYRPELKAFIQRHLRKFQAQSETYERAERLNEARRALGCEAVKEIMDGELQKMLRTLLGKLNAA